MQSAQLLSSLLMPRYQLNNPESVITDLVSHIQDPEFWDIKIICSDGAEIAVILVSIRVFVALWRSMGGIF